MRSLPLKRAMELPLKFVPLTVNVNAASATILLVGKMPVTVGVGLLTMRLTAFVDEPPPGAELKTTMGYVPAA